MSAPTLADPDAQAYIVAANIPNDGTVFYPGTPQEKTGAQLAAIIQDYVVALKNAGLWSKIKVDYPMMGGNASSHAINLISPPEHIVSWYGGWVHDELGAKPNGFNCYGLTGFIPSNYMTTTSNGITVAVGTTEAPPEPDAILWGSMWEPAHNRFEGLWMTTYRAGNYRSRINKATLTLANADGRGIYTGTRTNSIGRHFKNQSLIGSITATGTIPNNQFVIGCGGNTSGGADTSNGYDINRIQGALGHEGLTDNEIITLQAILDTREIALNRKTW